MGAGDISFKIDGTLMVNQPSGLQEQYPAPVVHNLVAGFSAVVESNKSADIIATWGVDQARGSAIAELRNMRGTVGQHTISYTDIGGSTQTWDVFIPRISYNQFLLASAVDQFSVTFYNLD